MKKTKIKTYENFPAGMVFLAVVQSILIYALGAYILFQFSVWVMVLFLVYCLLIEFKVLKHSCVNCYYYGKFCGLGRGKICSLFFKKGNPKNFCKRQISWKDLIPDFLVSIIPLIAGIILLIMGFKWHILIILILLLILAFPGTGFIRGNFACKYCKQREIACPAEKLFNKKKK
jgi:hypothetical protein